MNDLHMAVYRGLYEDVKVLVKEFDVNEPTADDDYREYALTIACKVGNRKLVKLLLKHGADPNVHDGYEFELWTPLHIAARNGKTEIVKLLLEYGAKEAPDWDRVFPARLARRYDHWDIVELLKTVGQPVRAVHQESQDSPAEQTLQETDES